MAERLRKEKTNLSSYGGEEGGESRVQNSPKAFRELKKLCNIQLLKDYH